MSKTKPLLLIFPFDLLSHYLRCLALAAHLRPYFEIRFLYAARYAGFVSASGFDTFPGMTIDAAEVLDKARRFDFSWLNRGVLEPVFLDQVRIIRALQPAFVLGDTAPTLKMAAEKCRVPFVALMNGYMSKYYASTRTLSRTHPAHRLLQLMPAGVKNLLTRQGEALAFYRVHEPFKRLRAAHGLSKKSSYLDELEGNLNLVCDLPELFPLKALPVNYRLIGPLFHQGETNTQSIKQAREPAKKFIYVSMGSSGDWQQVAFLNNETFGRYEVLAAGDSGNVLHAPHIRKVAFINAQEVMPFADLVICHGGNGTVYQALSYGVPVLCKTTHFEQEWNLDALKHSGAGGSMNQARTLQAQRSLVDHWVQQKNSPVHILLRERLQAAGSRLPSVAGQLARDLMKFHLPALEPVI